MKNTVKFTSGVNDSFTDINTQADSNDKIENKDIRQNLKEGFKEGAKEFWEIFKKPKNILIGLGVTGLGFGALAAMGLSFASCNVLFFGVLTGASVFAVGKNIKNYYKHKNDNQNNLAKNDIRNVGKNLFDISIITGPFAVSSILRAAKCTYTYMETAARVKNSSFGGFISSQYGKLGGFCSNLIDLEKINFEKFKLIKKLSKLSPRKTLAKTRVISGINKFSSKMIRIRGKVELKIIDFIDNKLNFNLPKDRISSTKLFNYMENHKHYYSKIESEINKYFDNASIRVKCFERLTKKAWKKNVTAETLQEEIRDVIGARKIINSPEEFESAFNSLKRLADDGKLVEVESHHGKGMPHFFTEEQELYLTQKGIKFIDSEKENGYQTINAIVKRKKDVSKKCNVKYYEVQIRGKHIDAIDSVEHKYYQKDPTGKLGAEKYGDLYKDAARADLGQPVESDFFEILNEIFDPLHRWKIRISDSCNKLLSKTPRFIPGSVRVNVNSNRIYGTGNEIKS
ncbi:MAG: hypothetical protein PHC34_10970 [Candidatus Gastranaerophilales bacterium]|nr:hypothetical protein [Candidatus Gastranaerophilales bacterium]